MSLWKIGADDVSEETQQFKDKLASKDGQIAGQQAKLMKQTQELEEIKGSLTEALQKLTAESDRVLHLQEDLSRCREDLRNEKNTSRNVEISLEGANSKLKAREKETRYLEAAFERLSASSNDDDTRNRKLEQEKAALEGQVRALELNIRHLKSANVAASRRRSSRSSSSQFPDPRINKVEGEIETLRVKLNDKERELEGLQERLAQAQDDLLRVDNEKLAQEAKNKSQLDELQSLLQEKDEELKFYREQQGDGAREEELLQRIEEDEARIAVLEASLSQSGNVKGMEELHRSTEQHLRMEVNKVLDLKKRNAELERERDGTLNELQSAQRQIQGLEQCAHQTQEKVDKLVQGRAQFASVTDEQLLKEFSHSDIPHPTTSNEVDVLHVARLLNAISRLRGERDDLRRNLEFLETEHGFTVDALEKCLASDTSGLHSGTDADISELPSSPMSIGFTNDATRRPKALVPVFAILLSHSHTRLEQCQKLLSDSAEHFRSRIGVDSNTCSVLKEEVDNISRQLREEEGKSQELEARLEATVHHLEAVMTHRNDLVSKQEGQEDEMRSLRKDLQDRLGELDNASRTLEVVESERDSLALQATNLTADLQVAQDELTSAESRYSALQSHQLSNMTSSEAMRALHEQISELEGRVMRRTEQIGIHQHDIRRLETNLKLQEERLGEMTIELETLATQKQAMLEDCADAREARDEALAQIETLEEEQELLESKLACSDAALNTLICLLLQTKAQARKMSHRAQFRITHLRDQLEESQVTCAALEEDLAEIRTSSSQDVRQATIAFATSQLRLKNISALTRGLMIDKNALTQDLAALREQVGQQEIVTRRLEEECASPRHGSSSSFPELASRLSEHQAEIDQLRKVISELKTGSELSQKQLSQSLVELQRARQEKEDFVIADEEAKSHLVELHEAKVEGLERELSTAATALNEECAIRTASEKEQKEAQLQAQSQIDELEKRTDILNEELTRLSAVQEDLQRERETAKHESASLRTELAFLLGEKEKQEKVQEDMTNANQHLSEEISRLLKERETLVPDSSALTGQQPGELEVLNLGLESQVADLTLLVEDRTKEVQRLSQELDNAARRLTASEDRHAAEVQVLSDENWTTQLRVTALEREVEEFQRAIERNETTRTVCEEEKERLQEHITSLEARIQKSLSYTNALERQVQDREQLVETLRGNLSNTQAELSRADTSTKKAEMNLTLQSVQHKRELAKLQDNLAAVESRRNVEAALADLETRNNEMEELLRTKCSEIEENDDRALEMLKENKRLSNKVEALTRKAQNLQTKLAAAKTAAANSKVSSDTTDLPVSKPPQKPSPRPSPPKTESQVTRRSSQASIGTTTSISREKHLAASATKSSTSRTSSRPPSNASRPKTPERRLAPAPVFRARTPERSRIQAEPPPSVVGVKRRAPDDFEPSETVPPQGFTVDSLPSRENESTTPRVRRMFGNLQSGFTPIRNKVLSSPKRQSAVLSTPLIQDVTNSPRSSVPLDSAAKQKRSWLGKIRGTATQAAGKPASRQVFTYTNEAQMQP